MLMLQQREMHKNPKSTLSTHRTHPLWWVAAAVCSFLAILVIVAGLFVFVGYIVIHPRVPVISVVDAHLNAFQYSQAGVLVTQVIIVVRSKNDNQMAHAVYSNVKLQLLLDGKAIANLVGGTYEVSKNGTLDFPYQVDSQPIPLTGNQMQVVQNFFSRNDIRFDLKGSARAQWRVGPLGSVRFWCQLNCQLHFRTDGSYIPSPCTSKSK